MSESLTDFPNELLLAITEGLPDETLVSLTAVSSRFRQLAGTTYLHRLGIIDSQGDTLAIHLCDWILPRAVLLLFSIAFPLKVALTCDLFFILEYEEDLSRFCSETVSVTDLKIYIPDTELHLLRHARLPHALRHFLSSVAHSQSCTSITIDLQSHSSIQPRHPRLPTKRMRNQFSDIGGLMIPVERLSLSAVVTESEELWKVGRLLLAGPLVFNLRVEFHLKHAATRILREISFPALTLLHIRSPFPVDVNRSFLCRHANLCSVSLFTFDMPLPPYTHYARRFPPSRTRAVSDKRPTLTVSLPHLSSLQLSANYCPWLSVFGTTSTPKSLSLVPMRWCPEPTRREFCETLRDFCYCLRSFAMRKVSVAQLEINFPDRLATHLHGYHKNASPCATPDISVDGVKDLTLDFFLSSQSLSLVR